jgi:hypothetical protein
MHLCGFHCLLFAWVRLLVICQPHSYVSIGYWGVSCTVTVSWHVHLCVNINGQLHSCQDFAVTCDLFEQDVEYEPGVMAGATYQCGKYAGSLRKHIFREHLGQLQADVPQDQSTDVRDPVSKHFYRDVWQRTAKRNNQIYEEVRIATHLDGCLVAMHPVGHQTWWSVLFIPLSFLKLYFFLLCFLPYTLIFPSNLYFFILCSSNDRC